MHCRSSQARNEKHNENGFCSSINIFHWLCVSFVSAYSFHYDPHSAGKWTNCFKSKLFSIPLLSLFEWIRLSHSEGKIYKKNGKSRGVWVLFSPILLSSFNKFIPTCCNWLKRYWSLYIFLNYYLAPPRPTLSHCQEQSFNKTTLFTEVFDSCFDTMYTWSPVI